MKGVEAPPIGGLIRAIVVVLVVLFAGWLLLAWAVVKRQILGVPAAVFVGLVVLVGMHDAQAWFASDSTPQIRGLIRHTSGCGFRSM